METLIYTVTKNWATFVLFFTACNFINIDQIYAELCKYQGNFILYMKAQFIWINF